MTLCERCGSVSIVKAQRRPVDRLVALVTGKRPFLCRRCGWRARRSWTDGDLAELLRYGAGGAEPDPELLVLDGEWGSGGRQQDRREPPATAGAATFDLDGVFLTSEYSEVDERREVDRTSKDVARPRRSRRFRERRSRNRRVAVAILVTAVLIVLVVLLG